MKRTDNTEILKGYLKREQCLYLSTVFYSGCPVLAPHSTLGRSIFDCNNFYECKPQFTESSYLHDEYLIHSDFERTMMVKTNELSVLTYKGEYFNGGIYNPDIAYNTHGIEVHDIVRFRNRAYADSGIQVLFVNQGKLR